MSQYQGAIRKMRVDAENGGIAKYTLPIGEHLVDMNPLIGRQVRVSFAQEIYCVHCKTKTKKSFNQGYCYRCLITLAQCDSCMIKPENCHYHLGTCREPDWGEAHCLTDHFVYLANTGNTKVGITRHVTDGVSSRWIDQGASQAIPILRVKNRLLSGLVETAIKAHIGDKTNWRTMLKGEPQKEDLVALRDKLLDLVQPELDTLTQQHGLQAIQSLHSEAVSINYPVDNYPVKIKSINLDKDMEFTGTLMGIKGQYWLLDGDRVINMRKYAGYDLLFDTQ